MTRSRCNQTSRRGATIVEFALSFLLFLVMVVAVFEFGRLMWTYSTVAHAAREAARFAVVHSNANPATSTDVRNVVVRKAVGLQDGDLTVNTAWTPNNRPGSEVSVQVDYLFTFVTTPLLTPDATVPLSSTARMTIW